MKFVRIETHDEAIQTGLVKGAVLDSPTNDQLLHQTSITLSGWVLRNEESAPPIELLVEIDGVAQHYALTVERPDVVERVLFKESDARLVCGFRFTLPAFLEARIYLSSNETRLLWRSISIDKEDKEVTDQRNTDLAKILTQICQSQGRLQPNSFTSLKEISPINLSTFLSSKIHTVDFKQFIESACSIERIWARRFWDRLSNIETLSDWLTSAKGLGRIIAPNAFSSGIAQSSFSLDFDNKVNLIFFESDDEPFVVLQHVTFCDTVYFPNRGLAVQFQRHLTEGSINKVLSETIKWCLENEGRFQVKDPTFGGAVSGFGRPYHFFYDIIPALKVLHEKGLMTDLPQIFCTSGSFFAHPSDLFDGAPQLITAEPKDLRQRVLDRGEFHCHIGLPFLRVPNDLNHRVDDFLREAAMRKHPQPKRANGAQSLRLWCGITGQKRSWVEQVEGTAHILDQLAGEYPQLEVIFDGWTCPIDPGPGDDREIAKDEAVVADILSRMHTKVTTQSVIGKTSLEKIAIGMTCDAFVANYSTGSMHISRFADRPGVLHINTQLPKGSHIQHRAVTVPASRTRDVPDDIDKRADFVSYSIDPDDILLLLRGVIETRNR